MAKNIEITKGNQYVCTEDVLVGKEVLFRLGLVYVSIV